MPHIRKSRKNTTRHSRKSTHKTNKRRKSTKRSSRKMRGGCGCDKQQGGSSDENNLAGLNPPYPLSTDNQLPNVNQSSRLDDQLHGLISGGKHKRYKKTRRMRGGAATYYNNPDAINSISNSTAASIPGNLMSNTSAIDPDVSRQPVANTYGSIHSPPLV